MNGVFEVVFSICLICTQTENIYLNPGDEYKYSIFTGDSLTLQCPFNSSLKSSVRWSYIEGTNESILSIGEKLAEGHKADFRFNVDFTNHLKNVILLRIYNITSKEQGIYMCYYLSAQKRNGTLFRYKYSIRFANVTKSLTRNPNGTLCCDFRGRNMSAIKFIWEHRTLYGEHIRFIESVTRDLSGSSKRNANMVMIKRYTYCLHLGIQRMSKYYKEGEYLCSAQIFIYGRSEAINKTASIKIENIQGQPYCIMETRSQYGNLGTNIIIAMNFYSNPHYSALSFSKNDSILKSEDEFVNIQNISLHVYNDTVMVSGYEIIINITEFSEEDVGNYTVNIINEFGSCDCTVQLLFEDDINIKRYPSGNVMEGQSVFFVCQSISKRTTHNYSWTKNGITLSNSSSIVLENITQDDNGNYTCRIKNKQGYFTKNELLIVNHLSCTTCVTEPNELLLLKRFLGIGYFIVPFILLVVTVFCNICVHLYCKKLNKVTLETDENAISREQIEMVETNNGYHTINDDNFRIDDTEIENQSAITSFNRALEIAEVPLPVASSGGNELQIEEDDYLHPYCTVMQNVIEVHEYKTIVQGVVQRDGSSAVLN